MTEATGIVYLVGAGPGNIQYLTIQAAQLLRQADVLVYDALVDMRLLSQVPPHCQQINVGKRGGQPSLKQPQINQLLVQYCQQGGRVVRLKSGDPFIFGRCRSEIQALTEAGCPFEVIPGLSSALAGPCLAGIPLTDPVLSRCFMVLSAHEPEALNWPVLAQIETLVILMGGQALAKIVQHLQDQGRSSTTAIAVIRWCGQPQQEHWIGTLADIEQQTAGQVLSPAVIVVGDVVKLQLVGLPVASSNPVSYQEGLYLPLVPTQLNPGVSFPLSATTILVTRSRGQSSQFSELLQQQGATVLEMPTLEIQPPSNWDALDGAIKALKTFDWLILTSSNGVDYFVDRMLQNGLDLRSLAGIKIAVVGEKTAQTLRQRGIQPDFIPPDFVADSLLEHFPEAVKNCNILFPRVETGGRDVLVKLLTERGAIVTEVAAYQSGCVTQTDPHVIAALEQGQVDIVTFASSKTVQCFSQLLVPKQSEWLDSIRIASIGPQTSHACQVQFGRVDIEATDYTLEGLTNAIVNWKHYQR
jgi:uroporphyrinogen III methyltransferase / synthase